MLKVSFILLFICLQIFSINCYTINHIPRHHWTDYDAEPADEFLAKLLPSENLFNEGNSPLTSFDQTDGHAHGLQKRGRQCLWKVCSWALDKRSAPSNSVNGLSKLLY